MKKLLALVTLVAVTTVSSAAFAAGCGNNTGRNTPTRPTSSGTTSTGSGSTTTNAGTPR